MPVNPDTRSAASRDPEAPVRRVRVWDLPTRLFHWLAVVLVALAYVTERENWIDWHVRIGETLLALVLFRLLWGCFGSETARFARFVASPAAAVDHLRHLFHREPDRQPGHNPAGGWMVLVLLALLFIETLSGIYVYNEVADEGPLAGIVPGWIANGIATLHAVVWDVLLVAIALHLLAIVAYAAIKGHNLVRPMITGYKRLPGAVRAPRMVSPLLAVVLLIAASAVVALLAAYV
ncbi:cytochrome b/b6 domain-containing protein [Paraburkholderia phosphatilytica]|uniref:cytochrome b/b6 domain-containing protein n=1 Tax=Paraburkholderia phosphatilytica TaxID=2282883 RepID=UPI000E510C1D|nr:cytochrome b/b6 domain-containing protein [Paraburkholderia phosphatilytica]